MNRYSKRVLALIVGVLTIVGAGTAAANLILYAERNYVTQLGSFSKPMTSPWNMSANANDRLSSYKNQTNYSVAFWIDANGGGRCFAATPWQLMPSFWWWDDDAVSSFQLGRGC